MMRIALSAAVALAGAVLVACGGGDDSGPVASGTTTQAGGYRPVLTTEQCNNVEEKFQDMADLQKYTISRSCAFEVNSCHFDEDPPPMHTVGWVWNMINTPCNTGIPEYRDWDTFCKSSVDGGQNGVLVSPGDATNSYFMIRLLGDPRSTRVNMPLGFNTLSAEELYALEAWINGLVPGVTTPSDPIDYSRTPCPTS